MYRDTPLITKGVTSTVYDSTADDSDPPGDRVGHVALFDWDDKSYPWIQDQLEANGIGGPTVVFESSDASYHGWNLLVRSFPETATALDEGGDDGKHRSVGTNRGYWRLRVGPKVMPYETADGRAYKPATAYAGTVVVDAEPDRPISGPHYDLAKCIHGGYLLAGRERRQVFGSRGIVGDTAETEMYTTFTDEGKKIQRRALAPSWRGRLDETDTDTDGGE